MAQDLRTSRQLLLSPAENRPVDETNVVYLTQEKHPASQQVSSEDSVSASIQEVRLQVIEAPAQAGARDGQEAYEQGMGLKTVGLFRQAVEHFQHGKMYSRWPCSS